MLPAVMWAKHFVSSLNIKNCNRSHRDESIIAFPANAFLVGH